MPDNPYERPSDYTPLSIDDIDMLSQGCELAKTAMFKTGLQPDVLHINPTWWRFLVNNTQRYRAPQVRLMRNKVHEPGAAWCGLRLVWDEKLPAGRFMVLQSVKK